MGGVPGYSTFSFSSPRGRQITVSVNRGLTLSDTSAAAVTTLVATEFCGS